MNTRFYPYIILVLFVMVFGGFFSKAKAQDNRFKVITFNVLSFEQEDKWGERNSFDVTPYSDFLKDENADFIILNEVENRSSRQMRDGKYIDKVQEIADKLGMFAIYGYSYNLNNKQGQNPEENYTYCMNELYGNAILSRYPIIASRTMQLPRPAGSSDQRGAVIAEVALPSGAIIAVVATHFDHTGGQQEQAEALIAFLNDTKVPALLAGDLNVYPGASPIELIGTEFDQMGNHWVDYIFASKGGWNKISEKFVDAGKLSDHDPVIVEVELKK